MKLIVNSAGSLLRTQRTRSLDRNRILQDGVASDFGTKGLGGFDLATFVRLHKIFFSFQLGRQLFTRKFFDKCMEIPARIYDENGGDVLVWSV